MGFNSTDKSFAFKISSLFLILIVGVMVNKGQPQLKNTNQDIIKTENNNKPAVIQTISVKNANPQQLYNNPLR